MSHFKLTVQADFLRQGITRHREDIAHHSFIILIWKRDLVVMLKMRTGPKWQDQATGTGFRTQTQ